jgi:hypothetical protein
MPGRFGSSATPIRTKPLARPGQYLRSLSIAGGHSTINSPKSKDAVRTFLLLDFSAGPCSAESLFMEEHLAAALPRLTRLTSLALDKCELPGELLAGCQMGF